MERKLGEVGSLPGHEPLGAQAQKGTPSAGDIISLQFRLRAPSPRFLQPRASPLAPLLLQSAQVVLPMSRC